MLKGILSVVVLVAIGILAGCETPDKPHDYGRKRPPVEEVGRGGLGGKDLISSTDQLAADMLASNKLNASKTQWTVVVMNVENQTGERYFNYDIFIGRLKTQIARLGEGRVTIIENRDRFHDIRNKELEPGPDDFGQGDPNRRPVQAIQPDYALYGKAQSMDNRDSSLYRLEFTITDLRSRAQVWQNEYIVTVAR